MLIQTLEYMIHEGLRNGMSFKQIKARIPTLVAQRLGITVAQFNSQLEAASGPKDCVLLDIAARIAAQFNPTEQRAIARR